QTMMETIIPRSVEMTLQPRIGRPSYFEALIRHGYTRFGVYNRHYSPLGYSDPLTEYNELLQGVVLWPVAGERQVQISGPDAEAFTQLLTPRKLKDMPVGRCRYVLITAQDGGIVNDPVCLKLAQDKFWLSAADSDLLLWARGVNAVRGFNVKIEDPGVSVLQIQGPHSLTFIEQLAGPRAGAMRYFDFIETTIADAPVIISRTGWSNEWGYEVYIKNASSGNEVFDFIVEQGKSFDLKLGTVSQVRRVEGALLSWGADFGLDETPFDVGLGRLVSFEDGIEYIGRDALQERASLPTQRQLVGVMFPGEPLPWSLEPRELVDTNGECYAMVTSLVHSPRLNANIGFCLLTPSQAESNRNVRLRVEGNTVNGQLCDLPFVPHRRTTQDG
ncbi:MAG: glycine cleavage T C-terminal barrel domain-containing protein, partial [Gammaproteobacteria bacterium]